MEPTTKNRRSNILVLTSDLPYFPGKAGHDFFNLQYLSKHSDIGLISPRHSHFPKDSVANLEAFLKYPYFQERPLVPPSAFIHDDYKAHLRFWIARLPSKIRLRIFKHLLGIHGCLDVTLDKLMILSDCATQLFQALQTHHWHTIVLIQSSLEPWIHYLPAMGGKLTYFHDVRSDYLKHAQSSNAPSSEALHTIRNQEQRVIQSSDIAGFVSLLDQERAKSVFDIPSETGVAHIPVDTDYFTPAPEDWTHDTRPIVLFTGHLSHPPNVDAIAYFIDDIWPLVRQQVPDAIFQVVGMMPKENLRTIISNTPGCELHANVPDIRPYFWNARCYVIPMRYGGGVRQKIFESWSTGVPIICTTMAAEGTGAENGVHCFLEDAPQTFSQRIINLLQNRECTTSLIETAQQYVHTHYSIPAVAPQFHQLVQRAASIKKKKPFRVLFDLRWMTLGHAGGIEQASYELISAISQLDYRNHYRILAPRSACHEWNFAKDFNARFIYSDNVEKVIESKRALLINGLANNFGIGQFFNTAIRNLSRLHQLDFDIVHSTAGYIHPEIENFPNVLTINDLQHLHYPEFFSQQDFDEREKLYRHSANRAAHIVCISEFTRQDVHHRYGIPLEKMTTIWIIPSRHVWTMLPSSKLRSILSSLGLSSEFLFFPAHCWPHKNHERLIQAFIQAIGRLPPHLKLVLTGRNFPPDHPAAILIRDHHLENRVIHLGYRSPLEIRALFQGCMALVFPSLFEGYGMPVAEAIIAGKPVLCSNVTSLPEIAGDAALTFDPTDIDALADALIQISTSTSLKTQLHRAALARRPLFKSRRHAIETMSIYRRLYDDMYTTDL